MEQPGGHLQRTRLDCAGKGARAGNRLDATRTDALLSQLETGKINCVHLPRCDRLPPGVCIGITQIRPRSSDRHGEYRMARAALALQRESERAT